MPTLKFVLWQFIFLSLFSLRAFLPGDKNSEELVQSFEDELMSKSSVYRFFYGSEHCSERQQDVQSGVGFAGVSQPCIYKNTSYYDFIFSPSFCVVWAILWYISNGNLAKVSCCCRCRWKWSRSGWYWADGWCNGWGGTTLEFPWDSKSYLKGQVGLGVGKKHGFLGGFCLWILPGTSLLWYAACMFFIKWCLQFL